MNPKNYKEMKWKKGNALDEEMGKEDEGDEEGEIAARASGWQRPRPSRPWRRSRWESR